VKAVLRVEVEVDPEIWSMATQCPIAEVDGNFRAYIKDGQVMSFTQWGAEVTAVIVDYVVHTAEETKQIQQAREIATNELLVATTARKAIAASAARPPRSTLREVFGIDRSHQP
jgi:topoisomerase IA-like protein